MKVFFIQNGQRSSTAKTKSMPASAGRLSRNMRPRARSWSLMASSRRIRVPSGAMHTGGAAAGEADTIASVSSRSSTAFYSSDARLNFSAW